MAAGLHNLLLSGAILAHTVLGCCWHHTHPGESAAVAAGVPASHHGCDAHSHHVAADDEGAPHPPQDGHRHLCSEPDCMYVVGRTVRIEKPSVVEATLVADCSHGDAACAAHASAAAESDGTRRATLALRAALQVWLI